MLQAGYLKLLGPDPEKKRNFYQLAVPNYEVKTVYEDLFKRWQDTVLEKPLDDGMMSALLAGDTTPFAEALQSLLLSVSSSFDLQIERDYQNMLVGLLYARLAVRPDYLFKTNRESGKGRYDIMIIPLKRPERMGIILELKHAGKAKNPNLAALAEQALEQIVTQHYQQELTDLGVQRVLGVGLAFSGKDFFCASKRLDTLA
jgi:hypothetical protein